MRKIKCSFSSTVIFLVISFLLTSFKYKYNWLSKVRKRKYWRVVSQLSLDVCHTHIQSINNQNSAIFLGLWLVSGNNSPLLKDSRLLLYVFRKITSLNYSCDKVESKEGGLRRDGEEKKDLRYRWRERERELDMQFYYMKISI